MAEPPARQTTLQAKVACASCGATVGVALADDAELPISCPKCGTAVPNEPVLLANLRLARAETKELAGAAAKAIYAMRRSIKPGLTPQERDALARSFDLGAGDYEHHAASLLNRVLAYMLIKGE